MEANVYVSKGEIQPILVTHITDKKCEARVRSELLTQLMLFVLITAIDTYF